MASSSSGRAHGGKDQMDIFLVPPPVRDRLGDAVSDGLTTMFADAYRLVNERSDRRFAEMRTESDRRFAEMRTESDRRFTELMERFEHRLAEQLANTRFDMLKWSFLFWISQVATLGGVIALLLRSRP
jgi:hypothetical protein